MELRYCENCGEILELTADVETVPLEGFVCASCSGGIPAGDPASGRSSRGPVQPAGDPTSRESAMCGSATRESATRESARQASAARTPRSGGATSEAEGDLAVCAPAATASDLGGFLNSPGLDLFSTRSVLMRKKSSPAPARSAAQAPAPASEHHDDLLDSDDAATIELPDDGDGGDDGGRARRGVWSFDEPAGGASRVDAEGAAFFGRDPVVDEAVPEEGELVGSQLPAASASKIVFRCPHCASALSIRPVASTSRLACPTCDESVYVTMSGRVFDSPPSARDHRSAIRSSATRKEPIAGVGPPSGDSARKVLAAGLRASNPLDGDGRESDDESDSSPEHRPDGGTHRSAGTEPTPRDRGPGAERGQPRRASDKVSEKLTAFRQQAEGADPQKTFFITDEKTSELTGAEFDSRAIRRSRAAANARAAAPRDDALQRTREASDGTAPPRPAHAEDATNAAVGERAPCGETTKSPGSSAAVTEAAHGGHGAGARRAGRRPAQTAKRRRQGTSPKESLGRLVGAGLVITACLSAPIATFATLARAAAVPDAATGAPLQARVGETVATAVAKVRERVGLGPR